MTEDVTKEMFLELWDKAHRLDPAKGSASGWMMT